MQLARASGRRGRLPIPAMIEVQNVTRFFGKNVGVKDLTFSVERGEILGLLGPNGAGKTTTMRMITGFLPPSSGSILVDGFQVAENPIEVKRRVGYLPEGAPFYREMTVNDYLHTLAGLKGITGGRERRAEVDRVVEAVDLGPVRYRLTGNLSRGYRQRVGIAQALLGSPEVLILDEPTAGLDPRQIIEIRDLIRSLQGEHTVIISSHILPEVQMTCGRVVIINRGRLVAEDTPDRLAQRLMGQRRFKVRVRGPEEGVSDLLHSLEGVATVTPDGAGPEGEHGWIVEQTPEADVRAQLFFALSDRGWPMVELAPYDLSLEEIFLQLTTEEPEIEEVEGEVG